MFLTFYCFCCFIVFWVIFILPYLLFFIVLFYFDLLFYPTFILVLCSILILIFFILPREALWAACFVWKVLYSLSWAEYFSFEQRTSKFQIPSWFLGNCCEHFSLFSKHLLDKTTKKLFVAAVVLVHGCCRS